MEKAKAAASHFVSKSGHHDTTVQERVAPAVTEEKVRPTRTEESQEAIDREVHKDHHHTTVQPVHDREVRPEEHHHKMAPVVHKEFSHGNNDDTRRKLEDTASQFKNTSTVHDTRVNTSAAPTVEGEHVHHHVHEKVQPVIHKETITPEVVHTTVPIHETHHAGAEHHGTSVLPTKHLHEFTSGGGTLSGGKESHSHYEGPPRPYKDSMQIGRNGTDSSSHVHNSHHAHHSDEKRTLGGTGTTTTTSTSGPHTSSMANDGVAQHKKPSLMDKLNPMKDSDGDGKKGFMK